MLSTLRSTQGMSPKNAQEICTITVSVYVALHNIFTEQYTSVMISISFILLLVYINDILAKDDE